MKHTPETKKKISKSLKGKEPWNKGLKGYRAGIKRWDPPKGELNATWKGDKVGYRGIHKWVELHLGKPKDCSYCHNTKLKHRQYHWANISKAYKRELSDWMRLCVKCHKNYDVGNLKINV